MANHFLNLLTLLTLRDSWYRIKKNALAKKDSRFRKGNVIFSMRNVDTIGVIDKETGEIVWEFLNPDLTKAGKRMPLYRSIRYSSEFVEQLLDR